MPTMLELSRASTWFTLEEIFLLAATVNICSMEKPLTIRVRGGLSLAPSSTLQKLRVAKTVAFESVLQRLVKRSVHALHRQRQGIPSSGMD